MSGIDEGAAVRVEGVELEAGRALDGIVAERVMGYPGAAIGGWDDPRHLPDGRVLPGLTPREYSTDISAAWEVVEKLGETHSVRVCRFFDGYVCDARPHDSNGIDGFVQVPADTAPLAICRAAIRATAPTTKAK